MTLLLYHCRVRNYSTARVLFPPSDHTAGDEKHSVNILLNLPDFVEIEPESSIIKLRFETDRQELTYEIQGDGNMAFEEILKKYKTKTCVLSIEKLDENRYGNIRVVEGNQAHYDDILGFTGHPFVPGCPYEMCFPKDMNFEDFCFRCAIGGEPMHSYVSLYQMGLWLNMFMIPLVSSEENIGYCIYSYDVKPQASSEAMSDVSADTSAKVLETCIKFRGSTDFRKTVDEVIVDIRDICGSDECCILLLNDDEKTCEILCEARRADLPHSVHDFIDDGFYKIASNWKNTLRGSTCIIIKDEHDMEEIEKRDPVWHETLGHAGIDSLVLFPLKRGEEILGYIWALNFNTDNTVKIKETLELTSFFLASEISNFRLVERLKILSTMDMLTGVFNRNEMNNRIDALRIPETNLIYNFGIVFADVNGLKRVNDTEGHPAGDLLLKNGANVLENAFAGDTVYRAGGDEFMVFVNDTSEEELKKKCEQAKVLSEKYPNVSFALGYCFAENSGNIVDTLKKADERMYEDKELYYKNHPELKR